MATTTFHDYNGDGSDLTFNYTFPTYSQAEVIVEVNNVIVDNWTITGGWSASGTKEVKFDNTTGTLNTDVCAASGAPKAGTNNVRIYRDTNVDSQKHTYQAGSSVKAGDLNTQYTHILRALQEEQTQTITAADIKNDAITSDKIADDQINSEHIAAGAVDLEHMSANSVDSDQYVDGSIDSAHIANDQIDSQHYAAGSIDLEHMSANSVDSDQYVDGSIDEVHLASGIVTFPKMAVNSVASANIVDDSIVNADINSSAAIAHSKLANITDGQILVGNGSNVPTAVAVSGDVTLSNTGAITIANDSIDSEHYVDGSIDEAHLAAGIVTFPKLAADAVTGANIADNAIDSEHYTDGSIDEAHLAAGIVTHPKLATNSVASTNIVDDTIVNADINSSAAIAHSKLAAVPDGQIIVGNGSTVPTAVAVSGDITIANTGAVTIANDAVEIGMIGCEQTTISDSDSHIPTSGAVVDYVAAQLSPVGGLEVIADDESFPETQPAAGVVISIADAGGLVVNGSGVSTTGDTITSNATVTINNINSQFHSSTIAAGVGMQVSSTGSGQIYNYHKALLKEADLANLSNDINDFGNRYRVNAGEPGSDNDEGDLVYDTNADKMKVYDSSTSAWKEVTSTGDFKFLVPVDAGTTTAATWDGSDTSFDLKEATNSGSAASVTNVNQLTVVLNGVVQKPNAGSWSGSGEGFYLTDADTIRFATAPPSGSTCFIVQSGSAVSIPTPGDGTVTAAKIGAGAVIAAKIGTGAVEHAKLAADCVDGDNIGDDVINSEHIAAGAVDLEHMSSQSVDEDNLYIDNAGSNGQVLTKQSGGTGGLLWADASGGGAVGGGSDKIFMENGQTVTTNYTIGTEFGAACNALSAGPITINSGITVTIDSGDNWTIV